jgi:hypothetical protein
MAVRTPFGDLIVLQQECGLKGQKRVTKDVQLIEAVVGAKLLVYLDFQSLTNNDAAAALHNPDSRFTIFSKGNEPAYYAG